MTHVTSECLGSFFQRYGWSFTERAAGEFESGWQGERQSYPLSVKITPVCVSFTVQPFLALAPMAAQGDLDEEDDVYEFDRANWADLLREICELNDRLTLVKVGLNPQGELTLNCQVLAAGFDFAAFSRILEVLGYYADVLHDEITPRIQDMGYHDAVAETQTLHS